MKTRPLMLNPIEQTLQASSVTLPERERPSVPCGPVQDQFPKENS